MDDETTVVSVMAELEMRLARMEATLDALRADVTALRETPRVEAPKRTAPDAPKRTAPDALAVLCERIADVARKRRRWPTTTYEVRELLSLGDVSGNTIDGAFNRLANRAVPGVKAERFGETHIPNHGAAALWILTAE